MDNHTTGVSPAAASDAPAWTPAPAIDPAVAGLHERAIVVDGHVHITNAVFNQGIDPWQPQETGAFDYARAEAGGLNVVVGHLFIEDRYNDYNYAVKRENWLRDFDATSYPRRTEALLAAGLSEASVIRVLGENWLRILDSAQA